LLAGLGYIAGVTPVLFRVNAREISRTISAAVLLLVSEPASACALV